MMFEARIDHVEALVEKLLQHLFSRTFGIFIRALI
jgi:hypothetical protein